MPTTHEKREAFRRLHEQGCFIIPNPWDAGSARWLESMGFKALASTSSATAWGLGRSDNRIDLEQALAHFRILVQATSLPVNADFEAGFAEDAEGVARNVGACLATGVAAVSIEDSTSDPLTPLRSVDVAVERIAAARRAIDEDGGGALLVGRAECFLTQHEDPLRESVRRLQAYAAAGADVLYAPGVKRPEDIAELVRAVAPKPLNVLALAGSSLAELAALGVRRISVGGALARAAWAGFLRAAREMAREGTWTELRNAVPGSEMDAFFAAHPGPDVEPH
jgi:2-methylisocitrate lyase-like PEP mutase family enzyme